MDVVNLGNTSGMMGVQHWPTYSSRVVGDLLDNLPEKYKDDFDRVRKNIYLHTYQFSVHLEYIFKTL